MEIQRLNKAGEGRGRTAVISGSKYKAPSQTTSPLNLNLKGSLKENNAQSFLATQTIIKLALITTITAALPCSAILGGVGSGKTGNPPLFWLMLVMVRACVHSKQKM